MADPLSITASIIAILQVVTHVAKAAKSYYHAPQGLESLLNDLADSQIIVQSIDDSIRNYKDAPRTPKDQLEGLASKLQAVKILVLELEQLAHIQLTKPSLTIKVNRASWTIAKTKVARLRNELRAAREDIRERLGLLKLYGSPCRLCSILQSPRHCRSTIADTVRLVRLRSDLPI
jgi:hypothetical protein